jgi:tetratricopeptide (TPR) repeat protein
VSTVEELPSSRFELVRRLGEGAMGVVWEAIDRERRTRVALKQLRLEGGDAVVRFKREFRGLQDIHHPNLVHLLELFEEHGRWFFTMELVKGDHLLEWLRGDGDEPDWERLQAAFAQLAAGLKALHDGGKVHRDIKPSNVVVTPEGRVVVLDFGLITESERGSTTDAIVGTAAYMAPEQAVSGGVGKAADWYAFGAVLFEALTGQVPFDGMPLEVLMRKQHQDAPVARTLRPTAPADLSELCALLLAREPGLRPTGAEVLARLGADEAPDARTPVPSLGAPFVGRRKELAMLRDARAAVRDGHAVVVALTGESGVGKTMLVRHFAERLREEEPGTVVLEARCFERESAHFKAADGLIDAVAAHLAKRPASEVAAVLPVKVGLLTQRFPALLRVETIAKVPMVLPNLKDPLEQRQRVFAAFRELLVRLASHHPLVLLIEDLQWADADSLALLGAALRSPGAPAALVLCTARKLPAALGALPMDLRELPIGALPQEQACDLAAALLRRAGTPPDVSAADLAREAGGQPMFIEELVRHVATRGKSEGGVQRLEDAIWARIDTLPAPARRVLELVALAGKPVRQDTAAVAANVSPDELVREIAGLRAANLVRTSGARVSDLIEPFHGRIRDVLLAYLPEAQVHELHRALAAALEATDRDDDEALAYHWAGAGQPERAADHADRAGERAFATLAFDRAARMLSMALELGSFPRERQRELWLRLGEARVSAGRGKDAAAAFLAAAAMARTSEALALRRRAADQLLRAGFIDDGVAQVQVVLAEVGEQLAPSPRRALARLAWARARLRVRGLKFRERDESRIPAAALAHADACWSVAQGLAVVDVLCGAEFQVRHLLSALSAGEPYRVARGLALEAAQIATNGEAAANRALRVLAGAKALAERTGNAHAVGLVRMAGGTIAYLRGRWREALSECDAAEAHFRDRCRDVAWELVNCQCFAFFSLISTGDLLEAAQRQVRLAREYQERGDLFGEVQVVCGQAQLTFLARDDLAGARDSSIDIMRRWSHRGFQLQHAYDMLAATWRDLYVGDGVAAIRRVNTTWPLVRDSQLLRVQLVRVHMRHLRGGAMLAAAAHGAGKDALLASAEREAQALAAESAPWARALSHLLRAGVLVGRGQNEAAATALETATIELDSADLNLYAACARMRRGKLLGGVAGQRLATDAESALRSRGVKRPDLFTETLVPFPTRR